MGETGEGLCAEVWGRKHKQSSGSWVKSLKSWKGSHRVVVRITIVRNCLAAYDRNSNQLAQKEEIRIVGVLHNPRTEIWQRTWGQLEPTTLVCLFPWARVSSSHDKKHECQHSLSVHIFTALAIQNERRKWSLFPFLKFLRKAPDWPGYGDQEIWKPNDECKERKVV